jgi:hypothetical protein
MLSVARFLRLTGSTRRICKLRSCSSVDHLEHITCSDVSRTSNISVAAYLRTSASTSGQETHEMGNDLLVGRVDLTPSLDAHVSRLGHYN